MMTSAHWRSLPFVIGAVMLLVSPLAVAQCPWEIPQYIDCPYTLYNCGSCPNVSLTGCPDCKQSEYEKNDFDKQGFDWPFYTYTTGPEQCKQDFKCKYNPGDPPSTPPYCEKDMNQPMQPENKITYWADWCGGY